MWTSKCWHLHNWYKNKYENTKIVELTEEEKERINKKLIDEIKIW